MDEMRATLDSLSEEQATLKRLAKADAARREPGTPSPPATDSRVSSLASGQQMQSPGLQGGVKNGEEEQGVDRYRREEDASRNTSSKEAEELAELIHTNRL
ncbi:hypothetical protein BHE74_00049797 [Ensete ventricosum]|nr:hypothetical protein BHE74_00049797 [Ensete ventricosum]